MRGVSSLVATIVLIAICIVASVLVYNFLFSMGGSLASNGLVAVEEAYLYVQTDGLTVFAVTVKNSGSKPVSGLTVNLAGTDYSVALPKDGLQPGQSWSHVEYNPTPPPEGFIVGNSYTITVKATFTDGSTFDKTEVVRCMGSGTASSEEEGGEQPIPEGKLIILLQGADFCFGFSNALSDTWLDEDTGLEFEFPRLFYLSGEAVKSPTGPSQYDDTIIYIWGHDFVYCWADEVFVYRPSSSEVVGSKSSENINLNFALHSTEATGSPAGPAQENDAVIYIWGNDFIYGWADELFVYRSSSSEVVGSKSSENINLNFASQSTEATGSPTGPAQENNAIIYVWGHDFIYGWSEEVVVYRQSSSEAVGPETSDNINPEFGSPPPEST